MGQLTQHQRSVITDMMESPFKVVALIGGGGVGKSFSIATLIQELEEQEKVVAITGTTHRAVKNISDMAGRDGDTIHRFLGMVLVSEYGNDGVLRQIKDFIPQTNVDVLIIEEASMMTNQLLKRLYSFIDEYNIGKVVFVGDAIQLRLPGSIDMSKIPAFELTEQMRQQGTPVVSAILKDLRAAIEENTAFTSDLIEGTDLSVFEDHCAFLKAYTATENPDKIFIAFQNRTVRSYNTNVKLYVHNDDNVFSPGDIIYPTSPILKKGRVVITNRQICKVLEVEEEESYYVLKTDCGTIHVAKNKTQFQQVLNDLAADKDWHALYELKDKFAEVHHTFAGTAHSLQGASISEVFIDYRDMLSVLDRGSLNDLNRLLYVGMSRCITKVNIFVGETRNYKCLGSYTPKRLKEK